MRMAVLYSGGKDSTYAMMKAIEDGHEITHLITITPKRDDSYMFHHPCIDLTRLQAESMGIKHTMRESSGEKEVELGDLKTALSEIKGEIDGVVTGAVSSNYQKSRIDSICSELGIESVAPLWGMEAAEVLKGAVDAGIEFIITSVSTGGLDDSWLGRKIDRPAIDELVKISEKEPFNVQFEGGEAESLVIDCPMFKKRLELGNLETDWDDSTHSGRLIVGEAHLADK